jgi:hypothetical protein
MGHPAVGLQWDANAEADFMIYRLYRGATPGFPPSPQNLIATLQQPGYVDPSGVGYSYKLVAIDTHGNESVYAEATTLLPTGVDDPEPVFALHGVRPNPSLSGELTISLSLATAEPAEIQLIDAAGRQVITRAIAGTGRHTVRLTRSEGLPAGVYMIRLRQGPHTLRVKAVVLR